MRVSEHAMWIADQIRNMLMEGHPVYAADLSLTLDASGEQVNFFPSETKGGCCETAYFISLMRFHGRVGNKRGVQHLSFSDALTELVNHLMAKCPHTREAYVICDSWDSAAVEKWHQAIKTFSTQGKEICFLLVSELGVMALQVQ